MLKDGLSKFDKKDGKLRWKLRVLFALSRNARRSDRELSRALGTTVSSVTRKRRELEEDGVIRDYLAVPAFERLGFNVQAFTYFSTAGSPKRS